MVKHTQTIRRQFYRRIVWMCLAILWGWRNAFNFQNGHTHFKSLSTVDTKPNLNVHKMNAMDLIEYSDVMWKS